jgi:hypothetical protein
MHHKIGLGDHQELWALEDFEGKSDTETFRPRAIVAFPEGEGSSRIFCQSGSSMRTVNFTCQPTWK